MGSPPTTKSRITTSALLTPPHNMKVDPQARTKRSIRNLLFGTICPSFQRTPQSIMHASTPSSLNEPSLCDLPVEIRLEICALVLELSNIPRSYGYTGPLKTKRKETLRKHGMLLVSKQFSAEYRQVFYERTQFFLRIDSGNAFTGASALSVEKHQEHEPGASPPILDTVPNFWGAPDTLLACMRHCTLYIEVGDIASCGRACHSLSLVTRSWTSLTEAQHVRSKMKTFSSLSALKATDSFFDSTITSAIHKLLEHMRQLRSIQLVWETTVPNKTNLMSNRGWNWVILGESCARILKDKRTLRSMSIKVGDRYMDSVYRAQRGEGGVWVERTFGI